MVMMMMLLEAAVLINFVLSDVDMVVVEAMAVSLADSSLSSVLNMIVTSRTRGSGVDKTYIAMRMVYWTTCCP
jgi:hypothetical protein